MQTLCRVLCNIFWTHAFLPESVAWWLQLIVPGCGAGCPWKAKTSCHSLSHIQWPPVFSGVSVCPTEGDNQFQIREWGIRRRVIVFVVGLFLILIEQRHLKIDRYVFLMFFLCCPLQLPYSKLNGWIIYSIKSIVTLDFFINSACVPLESSFFFFFFFLCNSNYITHR